MEFLEYKGVFIIKFFFLIFIKFEGKIVNSFEF